MTSVSPLPLNLQCLVVSAAPPMLKEGLPRPRQVVVPAKLPVRGESAQSAMKVWCGGCREPQLRHLHTEGQRGWSACSFDLTGIHSQHLANAYSSALSANFSYIEFCKIGLFWHDGAPLWPFDPFKFYPVMVLIIPGHPQTIASQQSWPVGGTGPHVSMVQMKRLRGK